jgi:CDP-4-dehydro-6-deoxyglucose reductase
MDVCRVRIADTGQSFTIARDTIVLDGALAQGVALPHQCRGAACGTCKARILAGEVDHGWTFGTGISEEEKAAGFCLPCQARPRSSELVLACLEPIGAAASPVRALRTRVIAHRREARRVHYLALRVDDAFAYEAGAHAALALPGVAPDRVYSFAAAPGPSGVLEFYIARHPHGLASGAIADRLGIGDEIAVTGPFGTCRLPRGPGPVLCLAGGTGLAPILAILEHALSREPEEQFDLLFSVRTAADAFALERLSALRGRHRNFAFDLTLTGAASPIARHRARIPELLPVLYRDLSAHRVVVAGSPAMVESCRATVSALGAAPDRVACDAFTAVPMPVDA